MSEKYQLSESDEDDEDYLPEGQSSASEEGSDGEEIEDALENDKNCDGKVQKRSKKSKSRVTKRKKNQESSLSNEKLDDVKTENDNELKVLNDEEQKKRADSLWADFLKDSALISKPKSKVTNDNLSGKSDNCSIKSKIDNKITMSKIFEFAGEKVDVENKTLLNSTENKLSTTKTENTKNINTPSIIKNNVSKNQGTQKIGMGGISAVLGRLEKKTKINTLEKSKMDWDNFKKQENIEDEINTHNRGKEGYLEKQDFLQRADYRQFEIEKQMRNSSRRSNR
ncbi:craniofacial development protein 1 [Leptopilina boulardi]|uniref:craniofacial development protein 1 n=1 Tax=Leptopilina boulardi TaxID=63433 RepID=UPI0021F56ECB|nr:craniofacial development protein 1 [Leptopilina boulardi]